MCRSRENTLSENQMAGGIMGAHRLIQRGDKKEWEMGLRSVPAEQTGTERETGRQRELQGGAAGAKGEGKVTNDK